MFGLIPVRWQATRASRATIVLLLAVVLAVPPLAPPASGHRHGCHRAHTCPSDHATYVWKGKRCVKPSSPKRTSKFKQKVRYGGKTYYCKRA